MRIPLSLLLATGSGFLLAGCTTPRPADPQVAKPAVLQMRLVSETPTVDSEPMRAAPMDRDLGPMEPETFQVEKTVLLDDTDIESAELARHSISGDPSIGLTLTDAGRQRFAEVTRQNIGKRLAIVIDGQVYSAPTIMAEIAGGKAEITGRFTEQEAKELADQINAAAHHEHHG